MGRARAHLGVRARVGALAKRNAPKVNYFSGRLTILIIIYRTSVHDRLSTTPLNIFTNVGDMKLRVLSGLVCRVNRFGNRFPIARHQY